MEMTASPHGRGGFTSRFVVQLDSHNLLTRPVLNLFDTVAVGRVESQILYCVDLPDVKQLLSA